MIKHLRRKSWKQHPHTIATHIIKHLGVTLTKKVKDLYDKNFKTLMEKKTEEDIRRWINLPCSKIR